MNSVLIYICALVCLINLSCSSMRVERYNTDASPVASLKAVAMASGPKSSYLPRAVIYRMNGDYSDYVHVNLTPDHSGLASYPAPTDISDQSVPVSLGDGWYYDRQGGISLHSAFLKYTYAEYTKLKNVGSTDLIRDIIPGATVVQCVTTPLTYSEANADPKSLVKYIPSRTALK